MIGGENGVGKFHPNLVKEPVKFHLYEWGIRNLTPS
jgi:hypothetical protein